MALRARLDRQPVESSGSGTVNGGERERRYHLVKQSRTSALVAAILTLCAAALVAGCGSSDTGSSSSVKAAGDPTDRAFIAEMVPHHRSAVQMAAVAGKQATSSFVKHLAADITRSQTAEIAQMQRVDAQLAGAGIEKGDLGMDAHTMGMDMSSDMLEGAKPFDAKFIAMMVPHHQGAIAMARVELAKGANPELKKLARHIITAQQREVRQMRAHAKSSSAMKMRMGH
jgi:uncharacterized protein (DUF305 family)